MLSIVSMKGGRKKIIFKHGKIKLKANLPKLAKKLAKLAKMMEPSLTKSPNYAEPWQLIKEMEEFFVFFICCCDFQSHSINKLY